jgi:hypothetical protein
MTMKQKDMLTPLTENNVLYQLYQYNFPKRVDGLTSVTFHPGFFSASWSIRSNYWKTLANFLLAIPMQYCVIDY